MVVATVVVVVDPDFVEFELFEGGGDIVLVVVGSRPFHNDKPICSCGSRLHADKDSINKLKALSLGKGFEIMQVYDGGEAIGVVKGKRPDLVILDLMLPHMNGQDICNTIKSDKDIRDTTVILVSAMDPTNNRFTALKNGADYYIKKPFDPIELRSLSITMPDFSPKRLAYSPKLSILIVPMTYCSPSF